MASKMHIKKDDNVVVISGKAKGTTGKVLKTNAKSGRVVVSGANMIKKHQKAQGQNKPASIVEKEGTIDASNVMLVCPKCGVASRVAHVVNADGSKDRVCKKCKAVIDQISKASKEG
ncbi:MAG TPA: 50S ribosomal protein L24 [Bacillota bacterium]|nr:50S ribosomal protein L24 [Bacillota bacterium]